MNTSVCQNCNKVIYESTYIGTPGAHWEPDYDSWNDRVTWRHLGGYATCSRLNSFAVPQITPNAENANA